MTSSCEELMEARECTTPRHLLHLHASPDLHGEGEQPPGYRPEVVRHCLQHHEVLWPQCSQDDSHRL